MIHIPDSVFPRDNKGNALCPKCRASLKDCSCPSLDAHPQKLVSAKPRIRLEKSGRKGKMVTLLEGFPADEVLLHDLSRQLKAATGSGGTCYLKDGLGVIEIQGDHRQKLGKSFSVQ